MGDISTWSPVDESNTAAPPNGWPESQATNTVNNCARAMMGGVRRWYDTITAQIASITASLGTFMPITGGLFTGPITAPQIHSNGTLSASGDINTSANINASGNITAPSGTVTAAQLTSTGSITASNNITATSGSVTVGLDVNVGRNIGVTGTVYAAGVDCSGRVNAAYYDCDGNRVIDTSGGATAFYNGGGTASITLFNAISYYDNNDHQFRNSGSANTFTIDPSGNVNATAQVQGASIYSRGNIDAAANISASGTIYAASSITAGGAIISPGFRGGVGDAANLAMYGTANTINFRWYTAATGQLAYRIDETVEKYIASTVNFLDSQLAYPGGGPTNAVIGAHDFPGTWYYAFIDYTSDERIKNNIAPTQIDALDILKQIPVDQYDIKPEVAGVFRALRGIHGREVPASSDHVAIGLVAQKLQTLIPEAVYVAPQPGDNSLPEDCRNISLPAITPYLIRAVQQLAARVEALERMS